MTTHETVDIVLDIDDREIPLREIPVTVARESYPGCRTYANGDPGELPYDEVVVTIDLSREDIISLIREVIHEANGSIAALCENRERVLEEFQKAVVEAAAWI
jgi:hypothetical protein